MGRSYKKQSLLRLDERMIEIEIDCVSQARFRESSKLAARSKPRPMRKPDDERLAAGVLHYEMNTRSDRGGCSPGGQEERSLKSSTFGVRGVIPMALLIGRKRKVQTRSGDRPFLGTRI